MRPEKRERRFRPVRRLCEPLPSSLVCRPLLTVSLAFLLVSSVGLFLNFERRLFLSGVLFVFAAASLLLCCLFGSRRGKLLSLLLLFSATALLLSEGLYVAGEWREITALSERTSAGISAVSVEGRVVEVYAQSHCVTLKTDTVDSEAVSVLCRAYPEGELPEVGQRLSGEAVFSDVIRTPRALSLAEMQESTLTVRFVGERILVEESSDFVYRLRSHITALLSEAKSAPLLSAILIADKSLVPDTFAADLRATGASHLLALSGLHLSLLVGLCHGVLRRLFCPKRLVLLITSALSVFFILVSCAPLSLVRAGGMLLTMNFLSLLRLRSDSLHNLFFSAALVVFFDRAALTDVGFLLSVSATFGILVTAGRVAERLDAVPVFSAEKGTLASRLFRRVLRLLAESFCTSYAALVFTLPIAALWFGEVSFLAPFFGILQIPLFTLLLGLSFVLLLALLAGFGGVEGVLIALTDAVAFSFVRLTEMLAALFGTFEVRDVRALYCACCLLLIFLLFCFWYRVRLRICALALPLFLCALFVFSQLFFVLDRPLTLALAVRESDESCLLLRSEGVGVLLENESGVYTDASALEEVLLNRSGCTVDAVVLTDLSDKTAGRLESLFAVCPFSEVWIPSSAPADVLSDCASVLERLGVRLCRYDDGSTLTFGGLTLTPFCSETAHGARICLFGRELISRCEKETGCDVLFSVDEGEMTPLFTAETGLAEITFSDRVRLRHLDE